MLFTQKPIISDKSIISDFRASFNTKNLRGVFFMNENYNDHDKDILQVEGINSKGFGTIPKLAMQDRRLTIQAKAIYAYFCSFAGSGKTAFPSRDKILYDLNIGAKAYYKHLNLLKQYGYIKCLQERTQGTGNFARNIYVLSTEISTSAPCTQKEDTVKNPENQAFSPCGHLAHTPKPYTPNDHTNINSIKINKFKNKQSVSQSDGQTDRPADSQTDIDRMTEQIKDNIHYDSLMQSNKADKGLIDECIAVMLDAMCSLSPTITIDKEPKPKEIVVHMLMQLDYWDMIAVIDAYKAVTTTIQRKRQYLLSMLYNIKFERNSGLTNTFAVDKQIYG